MKVHFNRAGVERLLRHTLEANTHLGVYEQKLPILPALWLVGDNGIYLLSNGEPRLFARDVPAIHGELPRIKGAPPVTAETSFVVYARECDPTRMPFNEWWEAKNTIFGGDDGADFFNAVDIQAALRTYRPNEDLIIDLMPTSMGLVAYRTSTAKAPPQTPKKKGIRHVQ